MNSGTETLRISNSIIAYFSGFWRAIKEVPLKVTGISCDSVCNAATATDRIAHSILQES
jgi:hypothetical protein